MARKKRKSTSKRKGSSSMFGALVIEGLAVVVFLFLFFNARAERQQDSGLERTGSPVQELFQQTPVDGFLTSL